MIYPRFPRMRQGLDVGIHHQTCQLTAVNSWRPAEPVESLGRVPDEGVDLSGTEIAIVEPYMVFPIQVDMAKSNFEEFTYCNSNTRR